MTLNCPYSKLIMLHSSIEFHPFRCVPLLDQLTRAPLFRRSEGRAFLRAGGRGERLRHGVGGARGSRCSCPPLHLGSHR